MKQRTKLILGLLCFLAVFSLASTEAATRAPECKGWYLIWHDEFDGETLDETKWVAEDAALVKNKELQYYTPEDVYVHDGLLTLRSQKRDMGGRHYTSGLVETKGKFHQKYGRFEIRAKLPKTRGMWPAHWLMPSAGGWPPEIDIMEMVGHKPTTVFGTIHWGKWPANRYYSQAYKGPDFSEDFHVFAIEWEPKNIKWFVDGNKYSEVKLHVPDEPFYIILNTAVGGMMPGNPDETTIFPQYHDIDYVRVYVKEEKGYYYLTTYADKGVIKTSPTEDVYRAGTRVALKAEANLGYKFTSWKGSLTGADNPVSLIMNNHKKVKAVFEVDPQAPKVISGTAQVAASSIEISDEDVSAGNLVDGDLKTRWSSEFSDPQWVMLDLGRIVNVSDIRLTWENAYAKSYDVEFSTDKNTWQKVSANDKCEGGIEEIRNLNQPARFIKFNFKKRATEWGYSLWEIEVFTSDEVTQE
jgi:beta-glucanase (GH16 family)